MQQVLLQTRAKLKPSQKELASSEGTLTWQTTSKFKANGLTHLTDMPTPSSKCQSSCHEGEQLSWKQVARVEEVLLLSLEEESASSTVWKSQWTPLRLIMKQQQAWILA